MNVTADSPDHDADLDPDRWFSPPPGTDGELTSREDIRAWLREMADRFPHIELRAIGTSTEGRPIDAVFIGDAIAARGLDGVQAERAARVERLFRGDTAEEPERPVVLVTSGIHATEVGGPQSIPHLVWWLATSATAAPVRERITTIMVPTLNPDGSDLVCRWHRQTVGTDAEGTNPPLLYHRYAGHDNNRDWLFRNLAETRTVLDEVHARWLPHVTLDQHQMSRTGPRFAMPPYADPWEPHIPSAIVAASGALGQAIAADMTLAGLRGVMTGRYFDAWEPSRALQHYRGGVRILAEAASAALAHAIEVSAEELTAEPLPQPMTPGTDVPAPWTGGRWGLGDIVRYHLAAATSLLSRVAAEPERWDAVQRSALAGAGTGTTRYAIPLAHGAIDRAANHRLVEILDSFGANRTDDPDPTFPAGQPAGPLLDALLLPKSYPTEHGGTAYDVTTHHLPAILGATLDPTGTAPPTPEASRDGRYLLVDARSHAAPEVIEPVLRREPAAVWRTTTRAVAAGRLIEPGTWVVDREGHPDAERVARIAHAGVDLLPGNAVSVARRDIVLLDIGTDQSEDHGWTRWWLDARGIPFLEASTAALPASIDAARSIFLIADTSRSDVTDAAIRHVDDLVTAGATAIAFGASGRLLAESLVGGVGVPALGRREPFRAPGALLRLEPKAGSALALGLDRWLPAMFQRDGAFAVSRAARSVEVVARFAARDTLVSGWISSVEPLRNAPAVLRIRHGEGILYAFAFRPLFRAQTLVTAPLVHNLLYAPEESASCPPSDREKRPADARSAPMS